MRSYIDKSLSNSQGAVEEYGSHDELVSRGVDPTKLLGLKDRKCEETVFTIKEEEEEVLST